MNRDSRMTGNYVEAILAALADAPGRVACVQPDGTEVTRAELAALVHRMANALRRCGVGRGTTVTTLSANRVEVLAARYAVSLLGARVVNLYEGVAAPVQAVILSDVDTKVLLVDPDLLDRAERIGVHGRAVERYTFDELLAITTDDTPVNPCPVTVDDPFCVRHTGGSTGHPKGVAWSFHTHDGIVRFQSAWVGPDTVQLVCTTLAHVVGMTADAVILAGGQLVLLARFDAGTVLAAVERARATDLLLLPPLLYALLDHPAIDRHDLSSLRRIGYGGSPASPRRIRAAMDRFGPILVQAYGTNETGGIAMLSAAEHHRPDLLASVGRPVPGIEIAIRDPRGADLPRGRHGEVCVRSATSGLGYWRDPEGTARVWRNGWVHTGDLGFVDDEGYLYLVGRAKDIVIVVGGHVYPRELEEVLLGHPAIGSVAVYGVGDEDDMERVHAAVVPVPGREVELGALREFVTERLGAMYAPYAVHVVEEIPFTDVGKPDVRRLRAIAG